MSGKGAAQAAHPLGPEFSAEILGFSNSPSFFQPLCGPEHGESGDKWLTLGSFAALTTQSHWRAEDKDNFQML